MQKHQQSEDSQPLLEEEQQEDLMDVEYENETASSKGNLQYL